MRKEEKRKELTSLLYQPTLDSLSACFNSYNNSEKQAGLSSFSRGENGLGKVSCPSLHRER